MFGQKSVELVKELDRNRDVVPPYNEELLRQVYDEMKILFQQNQADVREAVNGGSDLYSTIQWRHLSIERNCRCVLTYLYNRIMNVKDLRWDVGSILPEEVRLNLSENEKNFYAGYNRILADYMRSLGNGAGMDLGQHMNPPKSLYIQVRCLCDYGDFELEDGTIIRLKKGTQHFLPRTECEHLIKQGVLEHVLF